MKDDKDQKLMLEAFEQFMKHTMLEVHFEKLLRQWVKELQEDFRDQVSCVPEYTGKPVNMVICLHPGMELYFSKNRKPETGVLWDSENARLFIFKENICTATFTIPAGKVYEVMSDNLRKEFIRYFTIAETEKHISIHPDYLSGDVFRRN